MNREKYRKCLIVIFAVYLCTFIYYLSYTIYTSALGQALTVMRVTEEEDVSNKKNKEENYDKKFMPLGMPVGIYIRSKGVMVLNTSEITDINGKKHEPTKDGLECGDYIVCFNGKDVESIDSFTEMVKKNGDKECTLTILRDGEEKKIEMAPVQTDIDNYKLGVWVRQDAQGIGTLSFVDEDGNFAALGHGITDVDTSKIIDIQSGRLYESKILSIVKGRDGNPGEMIGHIDYKNSPVLGIIEKNNERGIYGTLLDSVDLYKEELALPIGNKDEVREGAAVIRCNVDGNVKDYDIIIEKVEKICLNENRNMVIEIIDSELLDETNGIIQGMSGSPLIQNGKLIGAVTHVLVNDPTRGYGIFIENMLETAG